MTTQITRWSPDTCTCIVEYSWDDTVKQEDRTHTLHRIATRCIDHGSLDDDATYAAITEENPRKNLALAAIQSLAPTLFDGDQFLGSWSFSANRTLDIKIPSTPLADASTLEAALKSTVDQKITVTV